MFPFLPFFLFPSLQGFEKSKGKGQNRSAKLKRASVGIQGMKRLPKYWPGVHSLEICPQEINLKWTGSKRNQGVTRNQVQELCGQEKPRQSPRAGRDKGLVIHGFIRLLFTYRISEDNMRQQPKKEKKSQLYRNI